MDETWNAVDGVNYREGTMSGQPAESPSTLTSGLGKRRALQMPGKHIPLPFLSVHQRQRCRDFYFRVGTKISECTNYHFTINYAEQAIHKRPQYCDSLEIYCFRIYHATSLVEGMSKSSTSLDN